MSYHVLCTRFSLLSRLDIKMFITIMLLIAFVSIQSDLDYHFQSRIVLHRREREYQPF